MSRRAKKPKPPTWAETVLALHCPECHAKPGSPCVYYTGKPTPRPHTNRDPAKHAKALADEAGRSSARTSASYGPLFQDLAAQEQPTLTARDVSERRRLDAAFRAESSSLCEQANHGVEWVRLWAMRHWCVRHLGAAGGELWDGVARTYEGKETYIASALRNALTTTEARTLAMHGEDIIETARVVYHTYLYEEGQPRRARILFKRRVVIDREWKPAAPVMTGEEFDRLFPRPDHRHGFKDAPEPDDGGLFARTVGALTRV